MTEKLFAINSVFISRENILFLEEWIDYHNLLGFNKFYLYDNSTVQKKCDYDKKHNCLIPGKVNKHNINYDQIVNLTDIEIKEILNNIEKKYKNVVHFIEWSPKDNDGNVLYNQVEAYADCLENFLKKDNISWCSSLDMDEYIVINNGLSNNICEYINNLDNNISNIKLSQKRCLNRFNIKTLITKNSITEMDDFDINHSCKNICKIEATSIMDIHECLTSGKQIHPSINEICFNHYKLNRIINRKDLDNINQ